MRHAAEYDRVEVEEHGAVTVVRMSHDENRLHPGLLDALESTLERVERSDGPGALVLTGSGKFFSNGLDLDYMSAHPGEAEPLLARVHGLLGRMLGIAVPTVAAINGHAFAAGAMLALTADEAVMRTDRGFFCLPEADIGLPFTPGMSALIASRLSPPVAHQAMVTARRYTAAEALAAGIVAEVAAGDAVLEQALARAQALATKPRHVIRAIKQALYGNTLDFYSKEPRMVDGSQGTATVSTIAELEDLVGEEIGSSSWVKVDQQMIDEFARATGDQQWIHVDTERAARESPFGSTIAHGFLILALAPRLSLEVFGIDDKGNATEIKFGVNYGLDKVRFISPVPVDTSVRARVSVLAVQREPNGAKFTLRLTFEREGSDRPVAIADWLQRVFT